MKLLAIDPGKHTGWVVLEDNLLLSCGLSQPPPGQFEVVVIEHPVIYPGGRTRNPNDIVRLAVAAGRVAGRYEACGARIEFIEPRTWKGTIDPDVCCKRVLATLTAQERAIYEKARIPEKKAHNVLDSIGLGLFFLKRFRT